MIHTSEPSCLEEELNRRKVIEHSPRWSCGFLFMHYMQILFEKCMFQWFLFLSSRINCWFLISRVSIRNPKAGIDFSMAEAPIIIETSPCHNRNLYCKTKDWFLYDRSIVHERLNINFIQLLPAIGFRWGISLPFQDGGRYCYCFANQWTGFYMITASVWKGLKKGGRESVSLNHDLKIFKLSAKRCQVPRSAIFWSFMHHYG